MKPLQRCAAWVVVLWGIYQARSFLIPMILASLLAFLLSFLVDVLKKKGVSEYLAITLSSVVLFLPVFVMVVLLVNEGTVFVREYPQILASLKEHWNLFRESTFAQHLDFGSSFNISDLEDKLSEEAGKGVALLLEGLKTLAEAGVNLLVVLFFSILMLVSRGQLRKTAEKLVSNTRTLDEIVLLIEKFLIARLGILVFVAVLDTVILKGAGSRYSVLLGVFLGLSTLIPIVGFLLAIVPPIALSFAMGHSVFTTGIMAFCLYLVSTIESHWITPKYVGRQLNLNLLAAFIGLFAGERLWGVWGIVLSIPVLGIIRIILESTHETRPWATFLADNPLDEHGQRKKRTAH